MLTLTSVNIGTERVVGKSVSGIYKRPMHGAQELSKTGIVGDVVSDSRHHGGPDQAVYVYGAKDYQWWQSELNIELEPGTFGDNLTISDLSSREVHIGDQFVIADDVVLEVTAPRIPCATLGERMGDKHFPVLFRRAERPGFYCRVIRVGNLVANSEVIHIPYEREPCISVIDLFRLYYDQGPALATLEAALKAPLAMRERIRLTSILDRLIGTGRTTVGN
ncbi:MAG: MOSC domain-containing protein [Gammaproteobacteria bacterium]|nr:MOSC domain-containing protein [Gammaproteobacteria bacterium]